MAYEEDEMQETMMCLRWEKEKAGRCGGTMRIGEESFRCVLPAYHAGCCHFVEKGD